jgi:hypothetical protein
MHNMHKKICLRLSSALQRDLRQAARHRHMTLSAYTRSVLQQVLVQSPALDRLSAPTDGAWDRFVMTLPPEVQQAIRQVVTATELPLGSVLKALIIAACEPKTAPQPTHESAGR